MKKILIPVVVAIIILFAIPAAAQVNIAPADEIRLEEFITENQDTMLDGYRTYGVRPSLVIAQWVLETGYGDSPMAEGLNNLFGHKASTGIVIYTTEIDKNGTAYISRQKFAEYQSESECVQEHIMVMCQTRYTAARTANTYIAMCASMTGSGYATDPNYGKTLKQIIERHHLTEIDEMVDPSEVNPYVELSTKYRNKSFRSQNIIAAQTRLAAMGYDVPVDGRYREETEEAVKEIQSAAGLDPTGVIDRGTHKIIFQGGKNENIFSKSN